MRLIGGLHVIGKTYNPLDLREVFKMKKGVLAAFMAAMLAFSLTACGGTGTSESTDKASSDSSSDKVVTLKFAHTVQSGTKTAECIEKFCEKVEEASDGRLKIENYPDSQLGDDDEICDQIYNGAAMLDYVDPAKMEDYYADYSILVTPYFFDSADEIKEFAWSDLGQELSEGCAANGMKCLDNMGGYYGARQIMSKKEIITPEDMKDVKFRVPSTTMWVAMANAWGTNATSVAFSEAYTALSQGVCDAIENPVPAMLQASFQEVCKYLNMTSHMYAANGIVMSNKVFEKLDKDLQDILVDTAKEFDEWTFTEVSAEEKEAAEKMKEDGVTINDQVDIEAFKEASESIYSTYEGWSDDLVEKCQKTLAEIRGE